MRTLGWWVAAVAIAVTACGQDDGGSTTGDVAGTSDAGADVATADTPAVDADAASPDGHDGGADASEAEVADFAKCTYSGRVVDDAGAPIDKVSIVICGEDATLCVKGTSKADGTWRVGGVARSDVAAKVLGGPSGHTSVSLPLAACAVPETELGDVVLFTPDAGATYDGVTGDWLQAHPSLALQLPPGVQTQMYEATFDLQAAAVALDKLHPLLAAEITPVAAFALVPYYPETPAPVPFEVTLPLASTTVGVYVLDYLTGQFLLVGDVAVDADGVATSTDQAGLPQLTWVAFVAR